MRETEKPGGIASIEARSALVLMRLTVAALFISVFFENLGKHLYSPGPYAGLIRYYLEKGTAPAAWKTVMASAAARASVAARLQGVAEFSFGVLLLLGLFSRPVALAAFGFLTSLWISESGTAWKWELLTPMLVCLAVALGPSGNTLAVDAWLKRRFPRYPFA